MEAGKDQIFTPVGNLKGEILKPQLLSAHEGFSLSETSFSETFPLFHLSKILGLYPIVKLSTFTRRAYICCAMAFTVGFFLISRAIAIGNLYKMRSGMSYSVFIIFLFINMIVSAADMICVVIHMIKLVLGGSEFVSLWSSVKVKRVPVLYSRYLTLFGIIFLLLLGCHMIRGKFAPTTTISAVMVHLMILNVLMQFCSYLDLLKAAMTDGPPKDPASAVEAVTSQHGLLKKAENANEFFAAQLFFISLRIMINTIIELYAVFFSVKKSYTMTASVFALFLFWDMFLLSALTTSCQTLKRKAKAWNRGLFKLMLQYPELCNNEKLRVYVQRKPEVFFTACDYFSIGYPFVTSVIAAALTYFVILIQFSVM